jgi:hypothetical protein
MYFPVVKKAIQISHNQKEIRLILFTAFIQLDSGLKQCFDVFLRERMDELASQDPASFRMGRHVNDAGLQRASDIAGPILQLHGERSAGRKFLTQLPEHQANAGGGDVRDPGEPPRLIEPAFSRLTHGFPIRRIADARPAIRCRPGHRWGRMGPDRVSHSLDVSFSKCHWPKSNSALM